MPLRTPLQSGDIVEILTAPGQTPSRDWLSSVVTSRARHKIRHFIHEEEKRQAVELGRRLLERELKKFKRTLKKLSSDGSLARELPHWGFSQPEDLFAAIGYGKLAPRNALERFVPAEELARPEAEKKESAVSRVVRRILPFGVPDIVVVGHNDLLATLAKCCNPVPGEKIIGYITRGRGVSVHSQSCPNVRNLLYDPERQIDVAWAGEKRASYAIELEVSTEDRPGLLADVTQAIAGEGSNIRRIEARVEETKEAFVTRLARDLGSEAAREDRGTDPRHPGCPGRRPQVQRGESGGEGLTRDARRVAVARHSDRRELSRRGGRGFRRRSPL